MIIPDVNLLLYSYNDRDPSHEQARKWWFELIAGESPVGIPWIVVAGFVRISTNPKAFVDPMTPSAALATVVEWLKHPHVSPLNPAEEHLTHFVRNINTAGTAGNLVTDAHIAAIAIEHDAEVHSADTDFRRFPGLRWHNPLQTAAT